MSKIDRVIQYKEEFSRWLDELRPYHDRFNENYKKFIASTRTKGTHAKISDPVAPELIERVVKRLFQRDPKFFADSKGVNLPKQVKEVMGNAIEYLWANQDTIQSTGSMRSKLKVGGREMCVTGNMAMEAYWNPMADCPDMRIIPIEDVIFNPTRNIKNSDVYYVRQFVSLKYLKDNVEVYDKNGKLEKGLFTPSAIRKLERTLKAEDQITDGFQNNPRSTKINRSSEKSVDERIQLITRYEGDECVRFVMGDDDNEPVLVQEYTNSVLGTHPYAFAVDIEVAKEPYGMSFIDFLAGLFNAKDLTLNQTLDYVSKLLNPPVIVDPAIGPVNLKTIANMYRLGGIVLANPQQVDHKNMQPLPNTSFQLLDYIQQRSESVTDIGAYLGGTPNQSSDKTQGTMGGIQALQQEAVTSVTDRQTNIEEAIVQPIVNKWLKMLGATMGENEFKWVLITGQNQRWIKLTKNMIQGKIRLLDLIEAKIIDPETPEGAEELQGLTNTMMDEGKDPEKDVMFDCDWIINVEMGSMAEKDKETELMAFDGWVKFNIEAGLPLNLQKVAEERALRSGIKDPEEYYMNPAEEEQKRQQELGRMQEEQQIENPPEQPEEMPQVPPQM